MPKSLQNYDYLTSDSKLRVNMNSLKGLPQNELIIVILNMVLWFFAEFLQYDNDINSKFKIQWRQIFCFCY